MSRARQIADFGDGIATADIDDGAVTAAKLFSGFANGVTMADQWRLTTNTSLSPNTGTVTTNWERADSDSPGTIGTAMSESSGIFTFPATGKYLIQAIGSFASSSSQAYVSFRIFATTDGSNYSGAAAVAWDSHGSNEYANSVNAFLFDVTNVTTHKVRFDYEIQNSGQLNGNSGDNGTSALFIRLGDT